MDKQENNKKMSDKYSSGNIYFYVFSIIAIIAIVAIIGIVVTQSTNKFFNTPTGYDPLELSPLERSSPSPSSGYSSTSSTWK